MPCPISPNFSSSLLIIFFLFFFFLSIFLSFALSSPHSTSMVFFFTSLLIFLSYHFSFFYCHLFFILSCPLEEIPFVQSSVLVFYPVPIVLFPLSLCLSTFQPIAFVSSLPPPSPFPLLCLTQSISLILLPPSPSLRCFLICFFRLLLLPGPHLHHCRCLSCKKQ